MINKYSGLLTIICADGLKIIIGKRRTISLIILISFFSSNLFAQTDSNSLKTDSSDDIGISNEYNESQNKKDADGNSGLTETDKSNKIQDATIDKKSVQKKPNADTKAQGQDSTKKEVSASGKENVKSDKSVINDTGIGESDKEEKQRNDNAKLVVRKPDAKINGLLDIKDADFKYSRIPGISFKKEDTKKESDNIQNNVIIDEPERPTVKESDNKSIIGMEKGAADIFVKILLVCLIIGIIILFKYRSKSRNNKVVRRFPGV